MKRHIQALAVLLAFGTGAAPTPAEGRNKSFTVSPSVIQGTVQGLMNGEPAPAVGRGFGRRGGFGGRGPAGPPPRTSFTFKVLPHSYMTFAVK